MTQSSNDTWTVTIVVPADSSLEMAGDTTHVEVREDETILAAARSAGVWLPADCQQGWCTTCAARVVDGTVEHPTARRYFQEDHDAGYILPCTAVPRSDATIVVDQYDEFLQFRAENDKPPGSSKID
jgi:ferredoxin